MKKKIIKPQSYFLANNKYYPCSTQEWGNSMYSYNKTTSKLVPVLNNHIFNLLKSYFNMFSKILEKNIGLLRIRKWKRRLIGRKFWISKPELKYSNNKITINLYVYNKQLIFFLKKITKLKAIWGKLLKRTLVFKNKNKIIYKKRKLYFKNKIVKIFKIINNKNYKENIFINTIEFLNSVLVNYKNINRKEILNLVKSLKKNPNIFNKELLKFMTNSYYLILIQKILTYQMSFLRIKQIILFNKLKYRDAYLMPIKWLIQKIIKKNIDFNLVSLKKFNYDSNILAQIVTSKIKNRRKKNKPLRIVKSSIRESNIYKFNKNLIKEDKVLVNNKQNFIFVNYPKNTIRSFDGLNDQLNLRFFSCSIQEIMSNYIKYKVIAGIKVQASGRITRRMIAQRATCKIRYKGTLKSVDSSFKGLSSVILKGYEKSGLQYEHSGSARRIGAFGIKVWINAY